DEHDAIAVPRVRLRVPAIVEVIAEAALRTTVDEEGDRDLARLVVGGLHHVAVHGVTLGALERELLGLAPRDLRDALLVEVGELTDIAAVWLHREQLDR